MSLFGTLGEFDAKRESWSEYTERLTQFFVANEVNDAERQRAIFITVVGAATYSLLKNLIAPVLPTQRTLTHLLQTLSDHFEPPASEIVERFKFNSRARKVGESVSTFLAELRSLAKHCNFGNTLDTMLRDRLVCGINNDATQKKLLAERNLDLARAMDIAISMEAASKNASDLRGESSAEVLLVKQRKSKCPAEATRKNSTVSCYCCGEKGHKSPNCKFKKCVCHVCGKMGHLAKVCSSKSASNSGRKEKTVNQLLEGREESTPESSVYDLFSVSPLADAPPAYKVSVKIQGVHFMMEVDTGAPFSIMPLSVFQKYNAFPPLQQTDIKLRSFTKHHLKIAGIVDVAVRYKSVDTKLPLLVVEQCSVILMGRHWIKELNVLWDVNSIQSCLSQGPQLSLKKVLENHKDLFSEGLGHLKNVKVHLNRISSVEPKFYKARVVPYAYRKKVEEEIERLLHLGILEPVSHSEWATPVVPVLKSNGRIRLCGDFKLTANKATELEQYPLPNVEDLFSRLSGGVSFSKIDLSDAYCQLELDDSSRDILVINTHRGLFKYTRLPFGVASAPAIFQREMDNLLQGHDNALCYLDDLLVTGTSTEDHLKNLSKVLSTLQAAGIRLHPSKCSFLQSSVEYLGHKIDAEGLHPIQTKLDAIEKAPEPTNVDELRSFLGLLTYYAKFLPNMSTMLAPLYKLLNKNQPWTWSIVEKKAFDRARKQLTSSSLLVHFDEHKEVQLECDASPYGVGAVLSHPSADGDRPIAFASRSLTKAERNYSQIEREALSLIFGVTRYRKYLLGRTFTLVTDHQPLVSLFSELKPVAPMAASRIQRWAVILSAYSYRIVYRKGALHANADACSRLPVEPPLPDLPEPADVVLLLDAIDDSPVTVHQLRSAVESDPFLRKVKEYIHQGWPKSVAEEFRPFWQCRAELTVESGIILRASRVFVPAKFRKYVLSELHEGHQGICALKAMARQTVWWPNIDKDIEKLVSSCATCQVEAPESASYLAPWPYTRVPWNRIHIDHAGPFENHTILLIVDAATKWLEAIPVPSTSSSASIAALRSVFARFGLPKTIVSDNGTSFTSQEFVTFLQINGITHVRTAPYHPQSNGQAERAVRSMKDSLRKIKDGNFQQRLDKFLFHYRKAPNSSTGLSPAAAMFGWQIRSRLDLLQPDDKSTHDSAPKYKANDNVWCRSYGKDAKWIPGEVTRPVGSVMAEVCTPAGHMIRHRDQLRHRSVELPSPDPDPSPSVENSAEVVEPEVLDNTLPTNEATGTVPTAAVAEQIQVTDPEPLPAVTRRSERKRKPPNRLDL